jgi:hypothetical protein
MTPGILPSIIAQINWPACCSLFSSSLSRSSGSPLMKPEIDGFSELTRPLIISLWVTSKRMGFQFLHQIKRFRRSYEE